MSKKCTSTLLHEGRCWNEPANFGVESLAVTSAWKNSKPGIGSNLPETWEELDQSCPGQHGPVRLL